MLKKRKKLGNIVFTRIKYANMFSGCINLTQVPDMFSGCINSAQVPELPTCSNSIKFM